MTSGNEAESSEQRAKTECRSTIERVLQTYLLLASSNTPKGVTEIAESIGATKASVHRILQHLVHFELAEHNPANRKYSLGPRAYAIAVDHLTNDSLLEVSRPYMDYLYELTGETVTLCKRVGFHNIYLGQIESAQEIHISVPLGEEVPLTLGANGLCQLAFMDEESIKLALSLPRIAYTDKTVTDKDEIIKRLAQIRQDGYSITSGERVPYCAGASAPILMGNTRRPIGAIGVAFLDSRFSSIDRDKLTTVIKQVARLIERRLNRS